MFVKVFILISIVSWCWNKKNRYLSFDQNGEWRQGIINLPVVSNVLQEVNTEMSMEHNLGNLRFFL
jgi:hypothetical protein